LVHLSQLFQQSVVVVVREPMLVKHLHQVDLAVVLLKTMVQVLVLQMKVMRVILMVAVVLVALALVLAVSAYLHQ
jgi:hypothetical protein